MRVCHQAFKASLSLWQIIYFATLFREPYSFHFEYKIKYFSLLIEHSCNLVYGAGPIKSKMALELQLYALIKNQYPESHTLSSLARYMYSRRVPYPPPNSQQGPKSNYQLSSPFGIGEGTSQEPSKRAGKSL